MSVKELPKKKETESFWLKVSATRTFEEEEPRERRNRAESEPKKMMISPRVLGKYKTLHREKVSASQSQQLQPSQSDVSASLFPPYLGPAESSSSKKSTKRQKNRPLSSDFNKEDKDKDKEEKESKKKERKRDKKKKRDIPDPKHTASAPNFDPIKITSTTIEAPAPTSPTSSDSTPKKRLAVHSQPVFRIRQPSPPPSSPPRSPGRGSPISPGRASPPVSPSTKGGGLTLSPPSPSYPSSPSSSSKRPPSPSSSSSSKRSSSPSPSSPSSSSSSAPPISPTSPPSPSTATSPSPRNPVGPSTSTSTLTNSILEGDGLRVSVKENIENDYELGDMLGSGAFAIVYKAVNKNTGEEVAVKKIKKNIVKESEIKNLRLEVKIMTELNHPGIIRLIDVYEEEESLFIITELMEGGELLDRLSERKTFCEQDAIRLVRNILEAIRYLHDLKIAHRDLKPENLLLKSKDNDTDVRLADFGISRFFDEGFMKTTCGTPAYTAPEVLESSNYTMAVDLWSIGIITYLLLSGKTPFQANSMPRMFMKIMEAEFDFPDDDWANVSESAKHFISQLLRKNPLKRMPAAEALKHRWLTEKGGKRTEKNLSTLASLKNMGAKKRGISQV